jgi:hypothetical protein
LAASAINTYFLLNPQPEGVSKMKLEQAKTVLPMVSISKAN